MNTKLSKTNFIDKKIRAIKQPFLVLASFIVIALTGTVAFSSTTAAASLRDILNTASTSTANLFGLAQGDARNARKIDSAASNGKTSSLFGFSSAAGNESLPNEDEATITTDKTDYQPGETVTVTGTGWMPGETVKIAIKMNDPEQSVADLEATADEQGNVFNMDFAPSEEHLGKAFTMTAKGYNSQKSAVGRFTDGSISYSPNTSAITIQTGKSSVLAFQQTVSSAKETGNFSGTKNTVVSLAVVNLGTQPAGTSAIPSGWVSANPSTLTLTTDKSNGDSKSWNISVSVPPDTAAGDYTSEIKAAENGTALGSQGTTLRITVSDVARPNTTAAAGSYNFGTFTNQNVAVALTPNCGTGCLGVASTDYYFQGATTTTSTTRTGSTVFQLPTISAEGTTIVNYRSRDSLGNTEGWKSQTVKIDKTLPVLTLPGNTTNNPYTVDATDSNGANVNYSVTATDNLTAAASIILACAPPSGSSFSVGFTTVDCSAKDLAGNTATGSFKVKVNSNMANSSLNAAAVSGTYGGTVALTATLTSGNSGLSGKSVNFTFNGASVGNATTDSTGKATLSNVNLVNGSNPLAVGSYGFSAGYAGDSAYNASSGSSNVSVSAADTTADASGSFSYDGSGHAANVNVKGANNANVNSSVNNLTVTYAAAGTNSDAAALPINAGTYDVFVAHNGNGNYKSFAKNKVGQISIGKADPTVTVTGGTFTYNGTARAATGAAKGVVNGEDLGAITLSYDTQDGKAPTNAGTYSVTAAFAGNGNYHGKNSAPGQLIINQAGATVTISGDGAFTYDGNSHGAAAKATGVSINGAPEDLGAASVSYSKGGNAVEGAPVDAGTYSVNASFNGNGNYKSANGAGQIIINQADADITAAGGTFTYTGNPQGGSANAKGVKGEALALDVSYQEGSTALQAAPVDAGTYTLTASFSGNGNYKGSSKSAQVKINPAEAAITANGGQFSYNGEPQGGNGNAKGVKNEDLAVTVSYTEGANALPGAPVDAGTYSVNVSLNSNRNYNAASKSATIIIGQADATVDVTGGTFNYTGDPQGGSGKARGVKSEDLGAVSISYTEGSNALSGAPSDAGTYNVKASFGGNRNYKATEKSAQIVINPVDPTIEGTVGALIYNGLSQGGNGGAKGVKGENLNGVSIGYFEGATALQGAPKDAGSYSMDVSYPGSRNYNQKNKKFELSIGQADSGVEISDLAGEFNGNGFRASAKVHGVGGESPGEASISYFDLTDNVVVEVPVNAGAYKATASFGGNRNYKSSNKEAKVVIDQATPTFDDFGGGSANYNGNGYGVSTKVHGVGSSELGDASISYVDNTPDVDTTGKSVDVPINAGIYTATASFSGNRNYRAANKSSKVITILPVDATIEVDADPNANYDGNGHPIKGLAKDLKGAKLGDATINYVDDTTGSEATNPTDAGHYTATAKFTGNRNYKAGNKGGGVTIKQVDSTIEVSGGSFGYDGSGKSAAVTVKGVKGEDLGAADVTYTDASNGDVIAGTPEDTGTWSVSASHKGNRNYKSTNKSGQIKINPVDATNFSAAATEVEYNGGIQESSNFVVKGKKGEALSFDENGVKYYVVDANGNATSNAAAPFNVNLYEPTGKITGRICHDTFVLRNGQTVTANRCYQNYNPGAFKRRHKIGKAKIVVAVTGGPVQYSDQTLVKVKVTGAGAVQNDVNAGGGLTYTLTNSSNQSVGITPTGTTPTNNGGYDVVFTMLYAPGDYTLTANFAPTSPNLLSASGSTPNVGNGKVTVTQENAALFYTGLMYVTTSSTTSNSASVALTTTVKDITAVPTILGSNNAQIANPLYDANAGDISKATVTFSSGGKSCTANVGLVNSADKTVGTATCSITLDTGSGDAQDWQIHTVVSGYYARNSSADDQVITIAKPTPGLVTGGGYLVASASSGSNPADAGTKINYGFNIKNDSKQGPKGTINVIFRKMVTESDGVQRLHVFQIKGNAMTSLASTPYKSAASPGTATFNGKANIQDITDSLNVISLGGNQILQVTMTDNGEPGSADKIGIALFNSAGGMYFSSNWNGTKTNEQTLGGGNIQVR